MLGVEKLNYNCTVHLCIGLYVYLSKTFCLIEVSECSYRRSGNFRMYFFRGRNIRVFHFQCTAKIERALYA